MKLSIKDLQEQVKLEREKREKIARARVQKNEKLIEKFQKQMIDYEQEIQNLKDRNDEMKLKMIADKGAPVEGLPAKEGDQISRSQICRYK